MSLTTLQPPHRHFILSPDENERVSQLPSTPAPALVLILLSMRPNSGAPHAQQDGRKHLTDQQNRRQKQRPSHLPAYGALMIGAASPASRYPFPHTYPRTPSRSISLARRTICGIRESLSRGRLGGVCGERRWMMRLRRFRRGSSGLDSLCLCYGGLVRFGGFVGRGRYLVVIVRRRR